MEEATYHRSVLLTESVDGLDIQPDGVYIDLTFGGGGHSREILRRLGPDGCLFGFDQDQDAEKNIVDDDRFTFVRSNFRYVRQWMRYYEVDRVDGVLADLGVSSHHLDDESRGFSFRFADAPLDMRMNKRASRTAEDVLRDYTEEQLASVFYLYGELKQSRRLAALIVKARQQHPIETAGQLLAALGLEDRPATTGDASFAKNGQWSMANGQWKKDMARLFQALRIEVNHEMEALRDMLRGATAVLGEGGRLSVITYHSLEDRMVKNLMRSGNVEGRMEQDFFGRTTSPFRMVNNKVTVPSEQEIELNPRSRSAKLRVAEKIST